MKRIWIVGGIILVMLLGIYIVGNIYINHSYIYENKNMERNNNNFDNLTMMLETSSNSGEYQESKDSGWPSDDYTFNSTLSKCENGGELSWDDANNKVIMVGNKGDKCYVYFDKNIYLADYIKTLFTVQGAQSLYLHDNTLTNSAGDGSYRYAGPSNIVNNFVCFGTKADNCPVDNLYRIIGVFDNLVKLIKYDYAESNLLGSNGCAYGSISIPTNYLGNKTGTLDVYRFNNNDQDNKWANSNLNKINLNTNYLNNIGSEWATKIANFSWNVTGFYGAYSDSDMSLKTAVDGEIINKTTIYNGKIGLMYISDYGYAASPSAWNFYLWASEGSDYENVKSNNWMYMGADEYTITAKLNNSELYEIASSGAVYHATPFLLNQNGLGIRPSFYLNAYVRYVSGDGTRNNPFIIS